MSLRDRLIEALAVELHDQAPDVIEENYAVAAEFVLDAILAVLSESADEWATQDIAVWGDIDNLLAVLQGEPDE
jgi:hypothetical protein